jgi:hypothetical protein
MLKINILYRFKLFPNIICDDKKNLYQLEDKTGKRYKPLRKLSFNEKRKSYYINSIPVTKKRLYNLMYKSEGTIILKHENLPF